MSDRDELSLPGAWRLALDAAAAAAIGMACIYVSLALQDGFGDWDLHRMGRHFLYNARWWVPRAAVIGVCLRVIYNQALKPGNFLVGTLYGVPRMFLFFPVIAFMCFTEFGLAGIAYACDAFKARRNGEPAPSYEDDCLPRYLGVSIWYAFLPFIVSGQVVDGPFETPRAVNPKKLLLRLPIVLAVIAFIAGPALNDEGERFNPYSVACYATVVLADYLIVAARLAPMLVERERRRKENPQL